VERRGGDIEYHVDIAEVLEEIAEPFDVPDVKADSNCDSEIVQRYQEGLISWLEVPLLVEDAVIGEHALSIGGGDFAVFEDGCAVVNVIAIFFCKAHNEGLFGAVCGEFIYGEAVIAEEVLFVEQIFGRIAAEGEFGKDDQIGIGLKGSGVDASHFFGVAGQITDDGVELCQCHAHAVLLPYMLNLILTCFDISTARSFAEARCFAALSMTAQKSVNLNELNLAHLSRAGPDGC